jgi:UDPglucose 6-dehydrogenase
LIAALQDMGALIRAFDPAGMRQAQTTLENVFYCKDAYDCARAADALVIATEWEEFRALDLARLHDLMACPVIVDLRNIYRPEDVQRHGFAYVCVGRSLPTPDFWDGTLVESFSAENKRPLQVQIHREKSGRRKVAPG